MKIQIDQCLNKQENKSNKMNNKFNYKIINGTGTEDPRYFTHNGTLQLCTFEIIVYTQNQYTVIFAGAYCSWIDDTYGIINDWYKQIISDCENTGMYIFNKKCDYWPYGDDKDKEIIEKAMRIRLGGEISNI